MAFDTRFSTPAALTGVARGAFQGVYQQSLVSRYLPIRDNAGISFQFTPNVKQLIEAARFRTYGTESDQAYFAPAAVMRGELPPISRRYNVDEYARLAMMAGDGETARVKRIADEFEHKAEAIAAQIAMRFVQAAAEGIETGKVTIKERGLDFEIDYGRRPELTQTVTNLWSDPTADVLGDLIMFRSAYGDHPGEILISQPVMMHLERNLGLIELAMKSGMTGLDRITPVAVREVLAGFGFTGLVVNDERLIDTTGAERTLFSQDKVIFLPKIGRQIDPISGAGVLGTVQMGITSESLEPGNGLGKTPGLAAGAIPHEDPNGFDVLVTAVGLPVISGANDTAALTVL